MATVTDPRTGATAFVHACRVCGRPLWFGFTKAGKRCPFDVDASGEPTEVSHFTMCPKVRVWTGRGKT